MSTYTEYHRLYWQSPRGIAIRKAYSKTSKYKAMQAKYRTVFCTVCGAKRSLNIPKPERENYVCYYCKHPENVRCYRDWET